MISVLLKVKFSVTDGATNMKCAIDNLMNGAQK